MPIGRPGDRRNRSAQRRIIRQVDARLDDIEALFRRSAIRLFARESVAIEDLLTEILTQPATRSSGVITLNEAEVRAVLRLIERQYSPGGTFHTRWTDTYTDLIGDTMRIGAADVTEVAGVDFNLTNPRVVRAVERRAEHLADHVGEASAARVTDAVRTSVEEGTSVNLLTKRIRDDAFDGEITTARARRIARTETVGARNTGEFESARESGALSMKTWLTSGDERVRDSHAAQHDMTIPIDERFPNGLMYPGEDGAPPEEVIQCRCLLLYGA